MLQLFYLLAVSYLAHYGINIETLALVLVSLAKIPELMTHSRLYNGLMWTKCLGENVKGESLATIHA